MTAPLTEIRVYFPLTLIRVPDYGWPVIGVLLATTIVGFGLKLSVRKEPERGAMFIMQLAMLKISFG